MTDLDPIQELSDAKLSELAAKATRSDLDVSKDKVFDLEIKLREAKSVHNRKYPYGRTFGQELQESLQKISKLEGELVWAQKDLDMRQHAADAKRSIEAREAHARLTKHRMFQVRDDHGRIVRHWAHDAEHLRRELTPGYSIIAEIYGFCADGSGGIAVSVDASVPSVMAGLLAAHGRELIAFLEEAGFERRQDA